MPLKLVVGDGLVMGEMLKDSVANGGPGYQTIGLEDDADADAEAAAELLPARAIETNVQMTRNELTVILDDAAIVRHYYQRRRR